MPFYQFPNFSSFATNHTDWPMKPPAKRTYIEAFWSRLPSMFPSKTPSPAKSPERPSMSRRATSYKIPECWSPKMDDVAVTELLSHETMETIVEKLASQFRDELKGKDEEVAKFLKQISKDLGAKVERKVDWQSGLVVERFRELAEDL